MSALTDTILRINNIKRKAQSIAIEEIKKEGSLLADLNREQLNNRKDANDNPMPNYVAGSKAPSAPSGITLFDTGDFHGGIETLFDSTGISMTSSDSKVSFLDPKYPTALGVAPSSIEKIKPEVVPNIIERLKAL